MPMTTQDVAEPVAGNTGSFRADQSVLNPPGAFSGGSARPANTPNSIIQRAFGRISSGRVLAPCRLNYPPYAGNDLICLYAGGGQLGVNTLGTPLLAPNTTDAQYQTIGITQITADATAVGIGPMFTTDTGNMALYEINGLKTRSVTHGGLTASGNTLTVPYPSAPTTTTFLLHVQTDNPPNATAFSPSGVVVDSAFGVREMGNNHGAYQLIFNGTGSAGSVTITYDATPSQYAVFALLSLAP